MIPRPAVSAETNVQTAVMETQVKGVNLTSLLRSLKTLRGAEATQRCVAACPPDLRNAVLYGRVVSSGWYPVAWMRQLHGAVASTLGTGMAFAMELSIFGAKEDLKNVYAMGSIFFSPQTLLKQSVRLMRFFFRVGTAEVIRAEKGSAKIRFHGFVGFDRLCWADLRGGAVAALECVGVDNIVHTINSGGSDGDGEMVISATWTERGS